MLCCSSVVCVHFIVNIIKTLIMIFMSIVSPKLMLKLNNNKKKTFNLISLYWNSGFRCSEPFLLSVQWVCVCVCVCMYSLWLLVNQIHSIDRVNILYKIGNQFVVTSSIFRLFYANWFSFVNFYYGYQNELRPNCHNISDFRSFPYPCSVIECLKKLKIIQFQRWQNLCKNAFVWIMKRQSTKKKTRICNSVGNYIEVFQ